MRLNEIIYQKVSQETGIPKEVIKEVYVQNWKFIKEKVESLPLKGNINIDGLRTSFNIKGLGNLYTTKELVTYLKERYNEK